jgi:hypothetical protein
MSDKIKEISKWLFEQGIGIAQEVLDEKLQEAYDQGRRDSYPELIDTTLQNIIYNTMRDIKLRKAELYEKNFYIVPSEEDAAQMRAYEYLTENLPQIIKAYQEN